jgi:hypothetical protein
MGLCRVRLEVAELARGADALGDRAAVLGLERVQFGLERR